MATTRKAPAVRLAEGPRRPVLLLRYLLGVGLISVAFLLVPRLEIAVGWRWALGIAAFVGGNVLRPLYRNPVRRRDQAFATAIETIHFLLLAIALLAIYLVLDPFPNDAVYRALLAWKVMLCASAFFALVGLRDLLHRWRG